jgi:hypothetical protein
MAFSVFLPMRSPLLAISIAFQVVLSAQDASLAQGIRIELATATNDTLRAHALARLCFSLLKTDQDSARYFGEQALALAQHIGDAHATTRANHYLGLLALEQGRSAHAQQLLASAIRAAGYEPRSAEQAALLRGMADTQRAQGHAGPATELYAEVLSIAKSMGQRSQLPELHQLLAELAVQRSEPIEATYHYHQRNALLDSARSAAHDQERAAWRQVLDSMAYAHRASLERLDTAHRHAYSTRSRWLLAASIGAAILLLVSMILLFRLGRPGSTTARAVSSAPGKAHASEPASKQRRPATDEQHIRRQIDPALVLDRLKLGLTLIREGRQIEALALLQGIARMMQYAGGDGLHGNVRLDDELAFLRQGVKVMTAGRSDITFAATAEATVLDGKRTLPAMAIWPFLQNLIEAPAGSTSEPSRLSIRFSGSDPTTTCTIRCEHPPMPPAPSRTASPFVLAQQRIIRDQLGEAFTCTTLELSNARGEAIGCVATLVFELESKA